MRLRNPPVGKLCGELQFTDVDRLVQLPTDVELEYYGEKLWGPLEEVLFCGLKCSIETSKK